MINHRYFIRVLIFLVLVHAIEGQERITLRGNIVAYLESNVKVPPHGYVPKSDVLFVRVKRSGKIKDEFVKIVVEYFSEKSPLKRGAFKGKESKFTVTRREECDSVFDPNPPKESVEEVSGQVWIVSGPKVKILAPDEAARIPKNRKIPCFIESSH